MSNLIQAHKLSLGYDELVLLKSFYGDLELLSGQLEVCGSSMRKIGNSELLKLRQQIGIIFQDYR
ncbi:ABC transporter ATP-binding protein, partial [Campylobacter coli CVM 41970]